MSVQAITWALGKAPNMATQAVLFSLANHADEWGITYVGQDTVARECVCRRPTVTTNLGRLEDEGVITRIRRHDAKGRRTSDLIILGPRWADRGEMADADKRARSMYPEEVCDLAGQGTSSEPSAESQCTLDESLSTSHGSLSQRGVHEPSEEPSVGTVRETERAREPIEEVWAHYQATRPHGSRCKLGDVERRMIRNALKVRELGDCKLAITSLFRSDYHVQGGYIGIKYALVGGGRSPDPATTIDRLVVQAQNGHANGNGVGVLRSKTWPDGRSWDDLTPREQMHAREALAMGIEPWREDARSSESWTPERAGGIADEGVTADTFLD